ncbi:integral membrane protein [Paramagnetospirillum caucaseum]|uniref:Integral membrane protein n=1 Tax=Paramagnetospirillum caucaseum TaxID=1244869 RepID=M2ZQ09_9PROT|nr:DUF2189 domain-containing protein [Paramagnetospirillum caucaseum]EME69392.1 integral membrane protein [Paramagnetospirillum caucaseum]
MAVTETVAPQAVPVRREKVRAVTAAQVVGWIGAGWRDTRRAAPLSLLYGGVFVAAGLLLTGGLALAGMEYLITPLVEGFMLVAPLLALGLYEISRRLERGEALEWRPILACWRPNQFHMMTAGLIYMLFLMIWARLAVIIFAVCLPNQPTDWRSLMAVLPTLDGIAFIITSTVFGGALATLAFVTNVVTLPAMLDRRTDFFAGAALSVLAVARNPGPMALWAALLTGITGLGLALGLVGLVVALPVVGHASWHAYRALVVPEAAPGD